MFQYVLVRKSIPTFQYLSTYWYEVSVGKGRVVDLWPNSLYLYYNYNKSNSFKSNNVVLRLIVWTMTTRKKREGEVKEVFYVERTEDEPRTGTIQACE